MVSNTEAIPGFNALIFVKTETGSAFTKVAEVRNINLLVQEELQDITPYNSTFRKFGRGVRGWSGQSDFLHIEDDAAQIILFNAIRNSTPVFIKITPDPAFGVTSTKRRIFGGLCMITRWFNRDPVNGSSDGGIIFVGRGPLEEREETPSQAASGEMCFCVEWTQLVYLSLDQTYQPPPAPDFSTGWEIDLTFYPTITGTGDAPEITIDATFIGESLQSNTLNGCPIPVYIRYLCEGGPISPSGAGTLKDDFLEVAEVTQDPGQVAIIDEMEFQTGLRVGVGGTTFGSLYDQFNDTFLPANSDYEMDLSSERIHNLEFLNTLDNLKNVDLSDNLINGESLDQMTDLNLVIIKLSRNLIGSDHGKKLIGMIATLKHVDLSFNFMHECFLFGESTAGVPFTIDFYDVSTNFLASGSNEENLIKIFNIKDNIFPVDNGGFWDSNTFRPIEEIMRDVRNSKDQTLTDVHDFSNTDLVDPHQTEIDNLTTAIATAQSITADEADKKVIYQPDYADVPHAVYNPTTLYGDQDTRPDDGF